MNIDQRIAELADGDSNDAEIDGLLEIIRELQDAPRAALEGAIRNIEVDRELQHKQFMESMLEAWAYDYEEDHVFPGDTLNDQYLAEYSRRAGGELHPAGFQLEISREGYEEIDVQGGVDAGIGIALEVLRRILEAL